MAADSFGWPTLLGGLMLGQRAPCRKLMGGCCNQCGIGFFLRKYFQFTLYDTEWDEFGLRSGWCWVWIQGWWSWFCQNSKVKMRALTVEGIEWLSSGTGYWYDGYQARLARSWFAAAAIYLWSRICAGKPFDDSFFTLWGAKWRKFILKRRWNI